MRDHAKIRDFDLAYEIVVVIFQLTADSTLEELKGPGSRMGTSIGKE
jgi:hypothetical protein